MGFKDKYSLEDRKNKAKNIREDNPNIIPCVVNKFCDGKIQDFGENIFRIPAYFTIGQFMQNIKKNNKLRKDEAIFIFVDGTLAPVSHNMISIYEKYKDIDGFLYIIYSLESVFGSF